MARIKINEKPSQKNVCITYILMGNSMGSWWSTESVPYERYTRCWYNSLHLEWEKLCGSGTAAQWIIIRSTTRMVQRVKRCILNESRAYCVYSEKLFHFFFVLCIFGVCAHTIDKDMGRKVRKLNDISTGIVCVAGEYYEMCSGRVFDWSV